MTNAKKRNFCPKCGHAIKTGGGFCSNCGSKTSNKRTGSRKTRNRLWIGGIVVAVVILITVIASGITSNKQKAVIRAHNTAQMASIASAFDCSCAQCDKTLANCDCPTAEETMGYIAKAVDKEKYSRKEIIKMVNTRYGYLRSDSGPKG